MAMKNKAPGLPTMTKNGLPKEEADMEKAKDEEAKANALQEETTKAKKAIKKTKSRPPPPPTSMAMNKQAPGLAKPTGISKTGMYFIY